MDERSRTGQRLNEWPFDCVSEDCHLETIAVVASGMATMPAQTLNDVVERNCGATQAGDEATAHRLRPISACGGRNRLPLSDVSSSRDAHRAFCSVEQGEHR